MSARTHIAKIRTDTFWIDDLRNCLLQQNPLAAKLRRTIEQLAEGLYSKDVHFIFELIQNAEDNHYAAGVDPTLSFTLTREDPTQTAGAEGALVIENNESGFQADNIDAICDVGRSTKTKQEGYIGEKGIGFKSVFQVSTAPHVFSGGYRIRLPEAEALTGLGYIVPEWVNQTPLRVQEGITTIVLPLRRGSFAGLSRSLRSIAPETILFLKKLRSLNITIEGEYECTVIKDDSAAPLVRLLCETVAEEHSVPSPEDVFWVKTLTFERPVGIAAAKREKITERDITVALPLSPGTTPRRDVYAYLPVLTGSGLPFLVNGDFLLTASREGIKEDEPWNHWLRDCIAPCFVTAFRELLLQREHRCRAYCFLPLLVDRDRPEFFRGVAVAIHDALKGSSVIVKEHGDDLLVPADARRGDDRFRTLFSNPNPAAAFCQSSLCSGKIERFAEQLDQLGVPSVTADDAVQCLGDHLWLSRQPLEWFVSCYEYLRTLAIDHGLTQRLRACAIVPIDGRLSCDCEQPIYLSASPEDRAFLESVPTLIRISVAFLRRDFKTLVENQPGLKEWLPGILGVYSFSRINYCIDIVNRVNRDFTGMEEAAIISGTRFLARWCDETAKIGDIAVILSTKERSLLSTLRSTSGIQHVVTPSAMDPGVGWQQIFETDQDRRHIAVLSNQYVQDKGVAVERDVLRQFFSRLGITDTPFPRVHAIVTWQTHEQSDYEKGCFAASTERSTGAKTLKNPVSPSWLCQLARGVPQADLDRRSKAVTAWLRRQGSASAASREAWLYARMEYSHYGSRSKTFDSEFVQDLKAASWLPTSLGFEIPKNAFIKDQTISAVLGQAAAYVTEDLPDWSIDLLGVRRTATAKDLVGVLEAQAEVGAANSVLASKIYGLLAHLSAGKSLQQEFRDKPLIYLPSRGRRWLGSGEVVWSDRSGTFGDQFGYLESAYPKLREFFVDDLGVKADVDTESFANRWLALASAPASAAVDIERPMTQIFQALLPDCRRVRWGSAPPAWWNSFAANVRFWCREAGFKTPTDCYVADDGEIRRVFKGSDAAFVWRPEKASYADIEDLYRALGARFLSESVNILCMNTPVGGHVAPPRFLTAAAKAQVLAWAANTLDKEQVDRLDQGRILSALTETQEESVGNLSILFTLGRLCVVGKRMAYWDLKNKRLFVEDSGGDREAVRQEVAEAIARGIMQNRPYRDVESLIFQVLCSDAARARSLISKRDWTLSAEGKVLLGEDGAGGNCGEAVSLGSSGGAQGQQEGSGPSQEAAKLDYASEIKTVFRRPSKPHSAMSESTSGPGPVTQPDHRRERTDAEIAADLSNEPPREERISEVLQQEWECPDPQVRQQLVEEYQGRCQICQDGFRMRTGHPFFISKYLVSRTKARTIDRLGNVLCLCANCSAKFQHGAVEMENPVEKILSLRTIKDGGNGEPAITVRLCGEDQRIVFSERHLIDLQELLKQLSSL
jgi:hypothetical protein